MRATVSGHPAHRSCIGILTSVMAAIAAAACAGDGDPTATSASRESQASAPGRVTAFTGATVFDGTGADPIAGAVILVRDGQIEAVGPAASVEVPAGAELIDLAGKFVIPGMINAHGHVGDTLGLESGHYSEDNVVRQLGLYARYGVTTVVSLGGDRAEAVAVRDRQATPDLDRARLYVAGPVVDANTPDGARAEVAENAALGVDFIKFRVDDNLGASTKMPPEVYRAIIDEAHARGLEAASHLFYRDDAEGLLRAGVDFVAHSVRDRPVDQELIDLFLSTGVCYCPTLAREVSTFVYESEPEFFSDPFFLKEFDGAILDDLRDPELQRRLRESRSAQAYKRALAVAQQNLKTLADAGVPIAMGTDTGPPRRFQGYFEHLELQLMAEAGLTPRQILLAATRDAAACLELDDVGTLESGRWADLVVLGANPLEDVTASRTLEAVYIAGNRVPGRE